MKAFWAGVLLFAIATKVVGSDDTIEGRIFIHAYGHDPYSFSDCEVFAFDLSAISRLAGPRAETVKLPKPISKTITDTTGRFKLKVPKDRPYFVFAQAMQEVDPGPPAGYKLWQWQVPMSAILEEKKLLLSTHNNSPPRLVDFEKVE